MVLVLGPAQSSFNPRGASPAEMHWSVVFLISPRLLFCIKSMTLLFCMKSVLQKKMYQIHGVALSSPLVAEEQ
jgi:hypothetical protein